MNAAKNVVAPNNPMSFQQMNTFATDPRFGGDFGTTAGYQLGQPVLGGALGQGGAEAMKQAEGVLGSGGTQGFDPGAIATQGAWGAGKGILSKLGVGGAVNMIPAVRNFTANQLINTARGNRGALTGNYFGALDNLDATAIQQGRTANMGDYLMDLATTKNPPTSASQEIAQGVIDEAGRRGIDLNKLGPKDSKQVQDIFDTVSNIWHGNPATTGVSRAQSGVNDMDNMLTQIRINSFPEFQGIDKSFSSGIKPFQSKAMTRAGITNSKGNVTGDAYNVAGLMDKSPTGARGEVLNANASQVFGPFGNQVLGDVAGFHRGVQTIGNIFQRIAQMAGGLGAGIGIVKGLGGGTPPPPP